MNLKMKIFMYNRAFFQKIRIGVLLFTLCIFSMQVKSQSSDSKILKLKQRNKVERLLQYSESDISVLSNIGDLRILGKVFLNNHYFEKAEICYKKILSEYDDLTKPKDYSNYYFCLLSMNKHDLVLESDKHKFDSDKWVSLLRSAARVPSYSYNNKLSKSSVLNREISSFNGFSVTNDTIYYFPGHPTAKAILEETNEILSHRSVREEAKIALLSKDSIMYVSDVGHNFNSKSLRYNGRQVFALQNSKGVFYSVESLKSGHQSIIVRSDGIAPFPFNSDDYDYSMPFFDEKSQILYFSSNRPGGYGDLDIYSSMFKDGKWLQPVNLGDEINTPFAEVFPMMSSCGLLFSSNGRAGMGGFDNYLYSQDDQYSYNLFPFNTIGDDFGLQEIHNTSIGFKDDNLVNYNSLLSKTCSQIKNNEKGLFAFLYPDKFKAANKPIQNDSIKNLNDALKLELEKTIAFENVIKNGKIYFGSALSTIDDSQFPILNSVCESILSLNIKQVYVFGYTDVLGPVISNNMLAYKRSLSVVNYLKARGATPDKVRFIPVVIGENLSESNEIISEERRVQFLIVEKVFNGIAIVAVNQPNSENLKYLPVSNLHLVMQGETLHNLSVRYNCPVELIKQINSRNNSLIIKGEYLFIPDYIELNRK